MLVLSNVSKSFEIGTINEKSALRDTSLKIEEGDFVTVIGGNGAGKSTLLNVVSGVSPIDKGNVYIDSTNVTKLTEFQRAKYIGRVFQDPRMGTAGNMTIEENLAMAYRRGKKRGFKWGITKEEKVLFIERLKELDLGLENRLDVNAGVLSGGQRQALTLVMATFNRPKILLLDEHTAALDPKTAKKVLELTIKIISGHNLTALMVTHNMKEAIKYGNRISMMHEGRCILDIRDEDKSTITVSDLLEMFEKASGEDFANDRMLLNK